MRLASVAAGGRRFLGMAVGERVADLTAALTAVAGKAPGGMIELIEDHDDWAGPLAQVQRLAAGSLDSLRLHDADALRWLAPVPNPSKIVCLALNNSANADRIMKGPKHPATFVKPSSALIGSGEAIQCRPSYGRVHPEPELAFVVGRRASAVAAEDAMDHVFGYTIHNDITSPTMRGEDTFHYRAIHPRADDPKAIEYVDTWVSYPGRYKCADTFSCLGPWLVTKDEVPDPHDLTVQCRHKGELVTEDNTGNLSFHIPQTIAFITRTMTLLPGDVVSMGTALKISTGGRGGAVQNIDLNRLGGPVSVSIERLGVLTNTVAYLPDLPPI